MKGLLNTIVKIIFSITIIVIWLVVPILADSQVDIWMIISPITLAAIGAIVYCKISTRTMKEPLIHIQGI